MAKPTPPKVNDLVLAEPGPSLWVITAVQADTRQGMATTYYAATLVGPPRPNSSLGRVVRTIPGAEILALYRSEA